jgi:two-component system, OmpR family, sensor kinase
MASFRSALAFRVALQSLGVGILAAAVASWYLRAHFLSDVDAALLDTARLEAQHSGSQQPAHRYWTQLVSDADVVLTRSANLHEPLSVPPRPLEEARRGRTAFATHRRKSETVRSVLYPLTPGSGGEPGQVLQVTMSLEPVQARLEKLIWLLAGLALLGTGFAWLLGWTTAGRALTPALALTAEAESIEVNELSRRVALPGDLAEFNRLASAFNALLDRLERAVTGTRRFTADASHELRAPLTVLRGELELALSRPRAAPEYEAVLRRCLDEVLRLVRLADDLLTLTRIQGGVVGGKRNPVELDDVVGRAVTRKAALAQSREVTVELLGTAGLVSGDADLLLRAVDGLVEHAIMASPKGGRVRVRLAADHRRSVEVTDGGAGLKAEDISGVFQRFYRSNRPRSSSAESGLGLPIARAVALSHGGALEYVGNDPGASFRMSLPAAE